jgi:hypothetical protein
MRRIKGLAVAGMLMVLCCAGGGGMALAQEEDGGEGDIDRLMARRISVDFKKTSFEKCLEVLATTSGVNVLATQKAIKAMEKTPVTFALKKTRGWATMRLFARSCGLEVSFEAGAFMFELPVKPQEIWAKVSMKVDGRKVSITLLRCDVPREAKRRVVRQVVKAMAEDDDDDDDDDGDDDAPDEPGEPEAPAPKPAPGKKAPRGKGEQF